MRRSRHSDHSDHSNHRTMTGGEHVSTQIKTHSFTELAVVLLCLVPSSVVSDVFIFLRIKRAAALIYVG